MRLLAMVAALTLAVSAPVAGAPSLASSGCPLFPADNVWHADVSRLPVHPRSGAYLAAMGTGAGIHADFGSGTWEGGPIGIPYTVVPAGQARVPVRVTLADFDAVDTAPLRTSPAASSGDGALLPRVLTVILGLTAATLATRAIRRPRHAPRDAARREAARRGDAPPDPDRSSSRRR